MKTIFTSVVHVAGLTGMVASSLAQAPNVVLILADDLGINDIGAYAYPSMDTPYPEAGPEPVAYTQFEPLPPPNVARGLTPRIDSLAGDGLRMTDFYAASPVCSPSRAALLTGSHATRVQLERVILTPFFIHGLHSGEVTLAERLRERGYRTALVGKWHLGDSIDFNPRRHGFDEFFGITTSNDVWLENPYLDWVEEPLWLWDDESPMAGDYLTASGGILDSPVDTLHEQAHLLEAFSERALAFMEQAHADGEPFFLFYPPHAPHVPCVPHPDFVGSSGHSLFYDVVAEMDYRIGQLLDKLDELGIAENTLVIFTSDNGPWHERPGSSDPHQAVGSAYPFRGYKRLDQEGGPRVPLLVRLPGIIPAGSVTSSIGANLDLMPTILEIAGSRMPEDRITDGISLLELWTNPTTETPPRTEFPYYAAGETEASAVRSGEWKLRGNALFNLASDLQESHNVATAFPDVHDSLLASRTAWNRAMGRRPRGNPQANQIEISSDRLTIPSEGGALLAVRLAHPENLAVSVSHFSGNPDVTISGTNTLFFDTTNHHLWQTVHLTAAPEASRTGGGATFRIQAGSLHLREVVAFPSAPALPDPSTCLPRITTSRINGDAYLIFSYRQPSGGSGTPGIDYVVNGLQYQAQIAYSPGSAQWQQGHEFFEYLPPPIPDNNAMEIINLRLKHPITPNKPVFLRLRIQFMETLP